MVVGEVAVVDTGFHPRRGCNRIVFVSRLRPHHFDATIPYAAPAVLRLTPAIFVGLQFFVPRLRRFLQESSDSQPWPAGLTFVATSALQCAQCRSRSKTCVPRVRQQETFGARCSYP